MTWAGQGWAGQGRAGRVEWCCPRVPRRMDGACIPTRTCTEMQRADKREREEGGWGMGVGGGWSPEGWWVVVWGVGGFGGWAPLEGFGGWGLEFGSCKRETWNRR